MSLAVAEIIDCCLSSVFALRLCLCISSGKRKSAATLADVPQYSLDGHQQKTARSIRCIFNLIALIKPHTNTFSCSFAMAMDNCECDAFDKFISSLLANNVGMPYLLNTLLRQFGE